MTAQPQVADTDPTQAVTDALVAELAHIADRLDEHQAKHFHHIKVSAFDVLRDLIRAAGMALIPSLPGTAGDGFDEARSYMALDWLIRTWLPTWLELSPACREDAAKVRELGRIVDLVSAERAGTVVRRAQETAYAAGAAAWAAARAAAWAVAWDVAEDVAWETAYAAGAAARDVLQPTVDELQFSAIDLYAEMIKAPWDLAALRGER